MSNLETTQKLFAIWNSREFGKLRPFLADDVEWVPATMAAVEGGSFHGTEGFAMFLDEWDKAWDVWEVAVSDVRESGDQVLVFGQVHARASGSGLELDQPVAYLFEFRDGLLARGATFFDHDEARAEARERGGVA